MPKRDTAKRMVIRQFQIRQKNVMKLLNDYQSNVSFTVDGWTSCNGRSYYGITVHFIGDDWKMHSLALDFIPAQGEHTGKAIAKTFFKFLENYAIQEKVQGITVDNASANTTFMAELKYLMEDAGYKFDNVNQHFRCFAHIMNLAVQDVLKILKVHDNDDQKVNDFENEPVHDMNDDDTNEANDEFSDVKFEDDDFGDSNPFTAITKLRNTFKKIRNSKQIQKIIKSFCDAAGIKYLKPILDVSTRWNSTDNMICVGIKMKKILNLLWSECDKVSSFKLSEDEWSLLIQIHAFLKDFETVSTTLGGEKYVILPLVIVAFNMLLDRIESATFALDNK